MINQFKGEHRWLSNFAPCNIILNGIQYKSVEHAYMSAKSDDLTWIHFCRDTEKPGDVKKASRNIKLKEDWDNIKINVMESCVSQKFSQEPYKTKLIQTGDQELIEGNTWGDTFWGVTLHNNEGQNNLGKIIMEYRDRLNRNG